MNPIQFKNKNTDEIITVIDYKNLGTDDEPRMVAVLEDESLLPIFDGQWERIKDEAHHNRVAEIRRLTQ